jgi:hypothetical protein
LVEPTAIAGEGIPPTELAAIRAFAEHLGVAPEDVEQWLRRPGGIPPQVLLSWITLWDLGRRKR